MKSSSQRYIILYLIIILGFGVGCKPTKYLKGEEKLLVKNSIDITPQKGEKLPDNLEYSLSTLEKQKPNERWAFTSTGTIYEKNLKKIDKKGLEGSRPWREKRGVPLAIYDQTLAEDTRKNMENYLNNLGYFEAKVAFEADTSWAKRMKVNYSVDPGNRYLVKSMKFTSEDDQINLMINAISGQSFLKPGAPISNELFAQENQRILTFLQNNGYAAIDKNFFRTTGDSLSNEVDVEIRILAPSDKSSHPRFKIGEVNVYPNFTTGVDQPILNDTIIDGIHYLYSVETPNIKASTIHRNIFIKPGDTYSQDKVIKTERLLTGLNTFRIITVKPVISESDSSVFNYNIYLTPRKKLAFGMDLQVTRSNNSLSGANYNLLGFFVNSNIQNYNYLKGAIQLNFGFKFGADMNFRALNDDTVDLLFGLDGNTNLGIAWPRFVKWIGPYGLLNKIKFGQTDEKGERKGIISDAFFRKLKESAKTKFNMRLSYQDIFDFYQLPSAELDYGYTVPINNNSGFQITHTGVDIFFPTLRPAFDTLIQDRPDIGKSFSPQLFTGLFFKEFTYNYSNANSTKRNRWNLRYGLELSGLEMFLANKIIAPADTFQIFNNFKFAHFARTEVAISQTRQVTNKTALAMRFQTGIAHSFGTSEEVPYVRQFFGGGPNSMRGWRIRELGPGGYEYQPTAGQDIYFQTGDFQLEGNLEFRYPLFSYLKGAVFFDAGNVWTLDEDPNRVNSKFRFKSNSDVTTPFYDQIAMATGMGFRLDISYFVLRFDLGIKLRSPYEVQGSYWFPDFRLRQTNPDQNLLNLGIDINYPF